MSKYGQYCPTARAVEILGDRWTLLIVRDLLCGAQHFNELQRGLPGIPKAVLADRLQRLQQAGVIERLGNAQIRRTTYQVTPAGQELWPIIESLTRWGAKWAFGEPESAELDPVLLLWWMRNRVNKEQLPPQRTVVEFDFRDARPRKYWLVLSAADVSICLKHPGYDTDILVTTKLAILYQVWFGKLEFNEAVYEGWIDVDATAPLIRAFPKWFALSNAAQIVKEVTDTQ